MQTEQSEIDQSNPETLSNSARVKSDAVSAELYTRRKPRKHRSEMQLVEQAFGSLPEDGVETVLDAPCGVGRLCVWLAQHGYRVTGVDLGESAVKLSQDALRQRGLPGQVEIHNIMAMDYADRQFDCTVCFRLLHHFEKPEEKNRLIGELCRVSARFVVISYFSPMSVTALRRRLRRRVSGRPLKQYPDSLAALEQYFTQHGFRLYGEVKRSKILHSLQLAIFERTS
ncbi:MAG: class I SAM-dependent methyltransferase [Gammaproteobacteria bacterium]|nr:class I SAM-dependent methyltransferase [Planctomycetaceae bacterium]MCB1670431.1 class I SAM-dependent methyltransferase [Pseudomonadales bacterium]MCP5345729.1 class I SAM-dependent methyltransferase [Pseudomonadales bacterium]